MAKWGYERSFTVEHDNTLKKTIDCKDCIYYETSDRSCIKRPLYMPEDGYKHWRKCKFFSLKQDAPNIEYKIKQLIELKRYSALPEK